MTTGMDIHFLSHSDILEIDLPFPEVVSIVEASLREHGEKRVQNPPKLPIHPVVGSFINAMPAYLPEKDACGLKWVAGFPTNTAKGLPTITAVMVLNDPETGFPLAFMDATHITAIRTVAVSVVAARHLCSPDASSMGLVGCGVQGRYHAVAMKAILPKLTHMKIHDPWAPAIDAFRDEVEGQLPGVEIEVVGTPEAAIRDTDLVVTATGKLLEPIFECAWVKEGALVLPVHTLGWDAATASSMDRLFTDDWNQFRTVGEKAYPPLPPAPDAETGEVVAGRKPGRRSPAERIVCFNKGIAIHDVLLGRTLYQKALDAGLGKRLELQAFGQELPSLDVGLLEHAGVASG